MSWLKDLIDAAKLDLPETPANAHKRGQVDALTSAADAMVMLDMGDGVARTMELWLRTRARAIQMGIDLE